MTCIDYVMHLNGNRQTAKSADVSESEFSGTGSRERLNVSVIAPLPSPPTARRPVRLTRSRCSASATTRALDPASTSVFHTDEEFGDAQYMRVVPAVDNLVYGSKATPPFACYTPDFEDEDDGAGVKLSRGCNLRQHSRQSSLSQASDISGCFGHSPLTPESCLSSLWSNSVTQGISASQFHNSHFSIKAPPSPYQDDLSHFCDTSLSLAGAGGVMAVPSASTVDMQRAKMRKFDIKISQFSVDGSPLPPSTRRSRDSTNMMSRSGDGMEDIRASDSGPVRTQKKSSRGRERVRIELAPDQPPTTQGKQRERVYVACLQCRSRKIRCDGARPMCFNCTHRATGRCEYDAVPKRRGPDRMPGSRQRPGKGRDRQSSEKEDAGKLDGDRKHADGSQGHASSSTSENGDEQAITPETVGGENTKSGRSQRRRRRSAATSVPPSLPADGGLHIPSITPQTAPLTPSAGTTAAVDADPNNDTWAASVSHLYHADLSSEGTTFVGTQYEPTEDSNLSTDIASNRPIYSYAAPQGSYVVTSDASLSSTTDNFGLNHPESSLPSLAVDLPAVLQGNIVDDYTSSQATQNYPSASLAPPTGFEEPRSGRLRRASGTTTLSSSASPEASSAGLSSSTDLSSPDLKFVLASRQAIPDYMTPNSCVLHPNPTQVDQKVLGHDQLDFGSFPPEVFQQMQEQLGIGVGVDTLDLDNAGLHAVDGLTSLALQQTYQGDVLDIPDVSSYNPYQWAVGDNTAYSPHNQGGYIVTQDGINSNVMADRFARAFNLVHSPNLDFVRKTWWDSLIDTYLSEPFCTPSIASRNLKLYGLPLTLSSPFPRGIIPTAGTRADVEKLILNDVQFLFRNSNYWFAFINIPLFFTTFCNPVEREEMQPALVLAILMMSNFLRSSEAEMGGEGRARTLWLREKAQAALEASVNAGWIDAGLAQAAWILAVFEVSAHPIRALERTESAFTILDNIIRTLALTYIDADIEDSSGSSSDILSSVAFNPRTVCNQREMNSQHHLHHPSLSNQVHYEGSAVSAHKLQSHVYPLPLYNRQPISASHFSHPQNNSQLLQYQTPVPHAGAEPSACSCVGLSLGSNWTGAQEHSPLWLCTPAWNPDWNVHELRREESRRLCWQALSITAGYTTYRAAMGAPIHDLFILQPSNFRLLFPGENLSGLPAFAVPGAPGLARPIRETVWALYARAMLLWHACVRIRGENVSDHERAMFANAVWREADAIENALDGHTCQTERAFLFQGREYLFNARMYVSYEFRRFVPHPTPNMEGAIHRKKAEEWLTHQATLSKRIMTGLQTVTGLKNNVLAKRPFFIFWFMGQIKRCLQLWKLDKSLIIAIQLSKQFLPPIDYLTALWPCEDQRRHYMNIRQDLEHACLEIGIDLPPPPNLTFSPTALP